MTLTNKDKGELARLRREVRETKQKCYTPYCNDLAIRSHVQQAGGPLKDIASTDGKVYHIEVIYPRFDDRRYRFVKGGAGIRNKYNDTITFWGFCNSCDTKIFKDIESEKVDYSLYKNQLLYSYRGLVNELYKQDYNLKWYEEIFKSSTLNEDVKNSFHSLSVEFLLSSKMMKGVKFLLEQDLNQNSKNFEFIYFTLPRIEICTASIYSSPDPFVFNLDDLPTIIATEKAYPILGVTFINLIPKGDSLHVILGCLDYNNVKKEIDLKKVLSYNQKEKIKLISDIIIRHLETWFVSPKLYNRWKQRKMDVEILNQIHKYLPIEMKRRPVKFNMFQDIV